MKRFHFLLGLGLLTMTGGVLLPAAPAAAQTIIKKNNPQGRVVYFLMVDSASSTSAGKTGLTGAAAGTAVTLTGGAAGTFTSIQYSTNGGALANCTGTITEVGKGYYAYVPTSAESNTTYDCLFVAQATSAIDYAGQVAFATYKVDDLGPQTDKIGTNAADSANAVAAQNRVTTGVPNAAPGAAGGLPTIGTGVGQINPTSGKIAATIAPNDYGVPLTGFYLNQPVSTGGAAVDPFAQTKTPTTPYGAGTWGAYLAGTLPAQVVSYAAGQDPASLIMASTFDGTRTLKQHLASTDLYLVGKVLSVSYNALTLTQTTVYARADGTTPGLTLVSVFDVTGRTVSRTPTYNYAP